MKKYRPQTFKESLIETIVQDIAGVTSGALIYHFIGPLIGFYVSYFQNGWLMFIHFVIGFITGGSIRRIAVWISKDRPQSWLGSNNETLIKYILNFFRGFLVNGFVGPLLDIAVAVSSNALINLITTVFGYFRSLLIRRLFERFSKS